MYIHELKDWPRFHWNREQVWPNRWPPSATGRAD